MLALVGGHALAAVAAPYLLRRLGPRAFWLLALVPAASFGWLAAQGGRVADGEVLRSSVDWVPVLGLEVALVLGSLQWVLALLVTGVGALVLAYCAWYFAHESNGVPSFGGHFVAFAGAMLGLVLSADLLLMYVFWELTTVLSFLLIGFDPTKRAARAAAMQALVVTTLGGLAMLVGVLLLHAETGSFHLDAVLADSPDSTATTVAVALLLVGAVTKSALVPFHFWLPGAMAAPTPVSAYLHAAAMVKAGVFLVALLAPVYAETPGWRPALLTLGVLTMLVGGWRALRQHDVKLLLAHGTVGQLGFLTVVAAIGTRSAAFAAVAMLAAHALFKAALFLVVGVVDHRTGTRDLRVLSGVGRSAPVLAGVAVVAGASMAGVPPLFGFVAKESVLLALVDVAATGDGTRLGPVTGWLVVAGVTAGSALTVAYTARFLWGTFATKPGVDVTELAPAPAGFVAAPVVLAGLSLVLALVGGRLDRFLAPYAAQLPPGAHEPGLALWHGLGPALWLSAATLAGGALLFAGRAPVQRLQARWAVGPSAQESYRATVRSLDRAAVEVTGRVQRGSVAVYLAVILAVVVLVPGSAAVAAAASGTLRWTWWDTPAQALVGAVTVAAAVVAARSRRRLRAVVLAGVTGYGAALLFQLHGAPDLALTQVLVETVTLVVFVLVLRRLPEHFTDRPLQRSRYTRMAIGLAVAAATAGFMLVTTAARTAEPVSTRFGPEAVAYGGGSNVVNVTLVDIRAWDTMGELAVLVVAATGVASLVFIRSRGDAVRRVGDLPVPEPAAVRPPGRTTWLPAGRTLAPERRSIIIEVVTRLLFHSIVAFSLYLLFSGHNNPGGGFAAGLVTGLALVVRYLAGGRHELDEAAPVDAGALIGTGLATAAGSALAPLVFGGTVLQSAVVDLTVPLLGDVHLVTSLFFDIGVYLVVVGLMLDLLRSLGSGIDRHILASREPAAQSAGDVP